MSDDNIHQLRALEAVVKQLREENARLKRDALPDGIPDCWEAVERFKDATKAGVSKSGTDLRVGVRCNGQGAVYGWTDTDEAITWLRHVCPTCKGDEVYTLDRDKDPDVPELLRYYRGGQVMVLQDLGFIHEGDGTWGTWRRSRK